MNTFAAFCGGTQWYTPRPSGLRGGRVSKIVVRSILTVVAAQGYKSKAVSATVLKVLLVAAEAAVLLVGLEGW